MDDMDMRLDGNAAAGTLEEIFAYEMTTARTTCAFCGAVGELGVLHAYMRAPGTVLRCPRCEAVLMRVVRRRGTLWLEARGIRSLEFQLDEG